jgi:hypothetical protein
MQDQTISYAAEKAQGILLRPALQDYEGQVVPVCGRHAKTLERDNFWPNDAAC